MISTTVIALSLMVILTLAPTAAFVKGTNESSYKYGFNQGKHNAKTNPDTYDSTDACDYYTTINHTAADVYACLKGYSDADVSKYHSGYLKGIQGIEPKGTHTQQFFKGYFKGIQGYWWNRGLAEGYSGLPMSSQNVNYIQAYKSEHREYGAGYPTAKNCGIDAYICRHIPKSNF